MSQEDVYNYIKDKGWILSKDINLPTTRTAIIRALSKLSDAGMILRKSSNNRYAPSECIYKVI